MELLLRIEGRLQSCLNSPTVKRTGGTLMLLLAVPAILARGQTAEQPNAPYYVDVIVRDRHANAPIVELGSEDFEVLEGRTRVPVISLRRGSDRKVRRLAVWLILQCNSAARGSAFMKGHEQQFMTELQKLREHDAVGVAQWCDNGRFSIDLPLTLDREAPLLAIREVLESRVEKGGAAPREHPLYSVVVGVLDLTQRAEDDALPVLIFLYNDQSALPNAEAEKLVERLLSAEAMVYDINNGVVEMQRSPGLGEEVRRYVVNFLSEQTGGAALSTSRGRYGEQLQRILEEVYGRYEIGIARGDLDGKRHIVEVKLTDEARKKHRSVELRTASGYMATPKNTSQAMKPDELAAQALDEALRSETTRSEVAFDAAGKISKPGEPGQFRIYIDTSAITWSETEDGGRTGEVTVEMASIGSRGTVLNTLTKKLEVVQSKEDLAGAGAKAVVLRMTFPLAKQAERVRFVMRDDGSGRVGTFDLAAARIGGRAGQ
jgi:hypothetical protein